MLKGVGCDLVQISRMDRYLDGLERRILSDTDRIRLDQEGACRQRRLEFLAGRFALREALVKAYHGQRTMSSFRIETGQSGEPIVLGEKERICCSISHDGGMAIALAAVEDYAAEE